MTTHSAGARAGLGARSHASGRRLRAGHPVMATVLRRIVLSAVLLLVVSALTFVLVSLSPGDPAEQILGFQATPDALARLRESMGLDLPLWQQYANWLAHAATGNLGVSITSGQPVSQIILGRLPVTLSLLIGALIVTTLLGVGAGVLAALRGRWVARIVDAVGLLGFAVPSFWLASELVALFSVKLGWFPAIGYTTFGDSPMGWLKSLVLPLIALSLAGVAFITKQTRESMAGVLNSEYIRMARGHGISGPSLILRYALRNAAVPVVTVIGVHGVALLTGTLFVENVFSLPGLGSALVQAALDHDIPTVLGITMTFTVIVIVINIVVDLSYSWLNPKVRGK
jgi:peptide/nickel transport system permease protein